jgi:hypothetical protein
MCLAQDVLEIGGDFWKIFAQMLYRLSEMNVSGLSF